MADEIKLFHTRYPTEEDHLLLGKNGGQEFVHIHAKIPGGAVFVGDREDINLRELGEIRQPKVGWFEMGDDHATPQEAKSRMKAGEGAW